MSCDKIFTTYFTGKPDPQSGAKRKSNVIKHFKTWMRSQRGGAQREVSGVAKPDEFNRMKLWYDTLINVGCEAVVFHDELSDGFTERHSCEEIAFERYALKTARSVNDERYLCYYEYLLNHPEIERVYMLDLFDIEFFKNPFDLIDDEKYDIYCGGDAGEYNDKLNREKMNRAFGDSFYEDRIKLNAGVCGGNRAQIMLLLETMIGVFDKLTDEGELRNLNMAIFNRCVYDLFAYERILYGYPLNSRFKKYENHDKFALRHK